MSYTKIKTQEEKRNALKNLMDDFTTFYWGFDSNSVAENAVARDMFERYGAFILNDKGGSVKFYNSYNYSNKYATPQFSANGSILTGIDFTTKKLDIKVGVYAITEDEYRLFLNEFNPYRVDYIRFGNSQWAYLVKPTQITDSVKHFIGKNEQNESLFYTEIKLTFEVQGPQCGYNINAYDITTGTPTANMAQSFLDTPVYVNSTITLAEITETTSKTTSKATLKTYTIELQVKRDNVTQTLFRINLSKKAFDSFKKENVDENKKLISQLTIQYNSELGIITLNDQLLTLTTSALDGSRLVNELIVNKFYLPGQETERLTDYSGYTFIIQETNCTTKTTYECHARTTII